MLWGPYMGSVLWCIADSPFMIGRNGNTKIMCSEFHETSKGYPQQLLSSSVLVQGECCAAPSHKFVETFQWVLLFFNYSWLINIVYIYIPQSWFCACVCRSMKGSEGGNLFMNCVSDLALESREFDLLLGVLEPNGLRLPGLIDTFQGVQVCHNSKSDWLNLAIFLITCKWMVKNLSRVVQTIWICHLICSWWEIWRRVPFIFAIIWKAHLRTLTVFHNSVTLFICIHTVIIPLWRMWFLLKFGWEWFTEIYVPCKPCSKYDNTDSCFMWRYKCILNICWELADFQNTDN
jgi:hypothetical protein